MFTTKKADKWFIEVTDITGKVLLIKIGKSAPGINRIDLDTGHFSNGLYVVSLKDKQRIVRSLTLNKLFKLTEIFKKSGTKQLPFLGVYLSLKF